MKAFILCAHCTGNRKDFDRWAKRHGLEQWAYEKFLPALKDIENYLEGRGEKSSGMDELKM